MTLYELHIALARNLGDPFKETDALTIYDGVRFSRKAREHYLYRATCSIINDIVSKLSQTPHEIAASVAVQLLSSMVSTMQVGIDTSYTQYITNVFEFNDGVYDRMAWIISTAIEDNSNFVNSVPMMDVHRAHKLVATSITSSQMNDPIAWSTISNPTNATDDLVGQSINLYINTGDRDMTGNRLHITYIRYPKKLDMDTHQAYEYDFEPMYMNTIIAKATLYGKLDGGDIQDMQVLPLIVQ